MPFAICKSYFPYKTFPAQFGFIRTLPKASFGNSLNDSKKIMVDVTLINLRLFPVKSVYLRIGDCDVDWYSVVFGNVQTGDKTRYNSFAIVNLQICFP